MAHSRRASPLPQSNPSISSNGTENKFRGHVGSKRIIVGSIGVFIFIILSASQIKSTDSDYAYQAIDTLFARSAQESTVDENDYQLAFHQSYGYFDDIPSEDWKLFQQRAREHVNHDNPGRPNGRWPKTQPSLFYMNNYDPMFTCAHERRLGGAGDGPKWTCDPHRLARIAKERQEQAQAALTEANNPQKNCLIYSVGCAGKYQWEEALAKTLVGTDGKQTACEIHVFDMSKDFTVAGHAENWNIHFHEWGLKSTYDDTMTKVFPPKSPDSLLTLEETMDKLGHTDHVIDILKIDCEFCEWFAYKDWLKPSLDIRQLLLETHNLPMPDGEPKKNKGGHWFPAATDKVTPSQFFDDIQAAGYAMYSKEANIHPQAAGNGVEFAYIKLRPEFFRADAQLPSGSDVDTTVASQA